MIFFTVEGSTYILVVSSLPCMSCVRTKYRAITLSSTFIVRGTFNMIFQKSEACFLLDDVFFISRSVLRT